MPIGSDRSGSKASRSPGAPRENPWRLANHDLRQPLQAIELLSEIVREPCQNVVHADVPLMLEQIARSLDGMLRLVTDICDLECGHARASLSPCRLDVLVAAVLDRLTPVANRDRVSIECNLRNIEVVTDITLLPQAVHGLVLFAIRHGAPGLVRAAIRRRNRHMAAIDIEFHGKLSPREISRRAIVEMRPLDLESVSSMRAQGPMSAPKDPLLGPGPALVGIIARHIGAEMELVKSKDGSRRMTLRLPVGQATEQSVTGEATL